MAMTDIQMRNGSHEALIDREMEQILARFVRGTQKPGDIERYEELRSCRARLMSPPSISRVTQARAALRQTKLYAR